MSSTTANLGLIPAYESHPAHIMRPLSFVDDPRHQCRHRPRFVALEDPQTPHETGGRTSQPGHPSSPAISRAAHPCNRRPPTDPGHAGEPRELAFPRNPQRQVASPSRIDRSASTASTSDSGKKCPPGKETRSNDAVVS